MNDTGNLAETLRVAVGLRYDSTHTIAVNDGICNGTPLCPQENTLPRK